MTQQREPIPLAHDSAADPQPGWRGRRPAWVWVIMVIYGLLACAVVLLPVWVATQEPDLLGAASVIATVLTLIGAGMIFTPVRAARRRPITRRSVWVPILASALLMGALVLGAGLAIEEFLVGADGAGRAGLVGGAASWIGWSILIWRMTWSKDPTSVAGRLHRWVMAGSIAELLIAVPTHLVCRRRDECCAGLPTGIAICIGVIVLFVAMGPSVVLLYLRRARQITPPRRVIAADQS